MELVSFDFSQRGRNGPGGFCFSKLSVLGVGGVSCCVGGCEISQSSVLW